MTKSFCPTCSGRQNCQECLGLGIVRCPGCYGLGCDECADAGRVECRMCEGRGVCPVCMGIGVIEERPAAEP